MLCSSIQNIDAEVYHLKDREVKTKGGGQSLTEMRKYRRGGR